MSENIRSSIIALLGLIFGILIGLTIFKVRYNKYDLTGDGAVNSADMLKLQRYIISQEYKYDVNQDGTVDAKDYMAIKNYIMGEK